jgi:hypothetical protein
MNFRVNLEFQSDLLVVPKFGSSQGFIDVPNQLWQNQSLY